MPVSAPVCPHKKVADRILIVYSSTDGHTVEICRRIGSVLEREGHTVALVSLNDAAPADPTSFDKVVLGASIRYGRHQQQVYDYIARHQSTLAARPGACFSVNVVARKPDKNRPDTNPYMRKFLRQIDWRPDLLAVFAGEIDYRKYRFFDRQIIRLIMLITRGPTAPDSVTDFTDWEQVETFGRLICTMNKKDRGEQ